MKSRTIAALSALLMLTGCRKSYLVDYNLRNDADNFKVRRKVVALNTRTDETLFSVEGYISIDTDDMHMKYLSSLLKKQLCMD